MLAPVFIVSYWFTIFCGWFGQPLLVALVEHLVLSETHLNSNGIYLCVFIVSSIYRESEVEYGRSCWSSRLQMFFKICVLENFTIFTGKHLCWSLFYKVAGLKVGRFPVNIAKFLRTLFSQNTSGRLFLPFSGCHSHAWKSRTYTRGLLLEPPLPG